MSGAETIAVNDHNNEPDDNISNSNNSRLLSLLFSRHCCKCVSMLIHSSLQECSNTQDSPRPRPCPERGETSAGADLRVKGAWKAGLVLGG